MSRPPATAREEFFVFFALAVVRGGTTTPYSGPILAEVARRICHLASVQRTCGYDSGAGTPSQCRRRESRYATTDRQAAELVAEYLPGWTWRGGIYPTLYRPGESPDRDHGYGVP